MEKKEIEAFFDRLAPAWDADMIRHDDVIGLILDNAEVKAGKKVLDVACGTGVLIPDYLARDVASITGVDLSSQMIRIAQGKFQQENVRFLCCDVEEMVHEENYDCIVVYNAFPHFPDPKKVIESLCAMLAPGGTLTVAHGMSRKAIDRHHSGSANRVSRGLIHEDELAGIMEKFLCITTKISDDRMYQVTGKRE